MSAQTGLHAETANVKPGDRRSFVEVHHRMLVCLLLAAATCIAYGRVWLCEFTDYDDPELVVENPNVLGGLTLRGVYWALTTFSVEYWHPLTWLSHMLDCQVFGLRPGWHHLVNLGFHIANTLLLFGVLQYMTAAWKRSALVAALFALHPLHVESVAWIAERKDVLSGFFFLLTLWAYVRYAEVQSAKSEVQRLKSEVRGEAPVHSNTEHGTRNTTSAFSVQPSAFTYYLLALVLFALGLMCKPMLMTLPFVLLLLDFWPLCRLQLPSPGSRASAGAPPRRSSASPLRLLREKLPFLALTAVSCVLAYAWAQHSNNILTTNKESWGLRLANVPISYARYLGKMIWPANLFVPYPMPKHWAWWQAGGALLLVVLITVFVLRRLRRAPYLTVGWFIFLGVLLPTIRIVHGGFQSIADRYTYLPSIGIFVAVVWAAADWSGGRASARTATLSIVFAPALLLCGHLTWLQVGYWRNSFTLWTHCLAICPGNQVGHYNLGSELVQQGRLDEAVKHYEVALKMAPALAYNGLGKTYALQGKLDDAMDLFAKASALDPQLEEAHFNLGNAYLIKGKVAEAIVELRMALRLKPTSLEAQRRLAEALFKMGMAAEALPYCEAVAQARPHDAHARFALGEACRAENRLDEAVTNLKEAVHLAPDVPECLNALAWVYATCPKAELRNGVEAVRLAEMACQLTKRQKAAPLETLAAAYAEAGRFEDAVKTAEAALALAHLTGDNAFAETVRQRIEVYKAGKPFRDER